VHASRISVSEIIAIAVCVQCDGCSSSFAKTFFYNETPFQKKMKKEKQQSSVGYGSV
jgi:hypothetical protein